MLTMVRTKLNAAQPQNRNSMNDPRVDPDEMIGRLFGRQKDEGYKGDQKKDAEKLRAAHTALMARETFKVGDVVVWKDGLRNREWPAVGEPVIVTEVYGLPVRCEPKTTEEVGSAHVFEPLDIKIGGMRGGNLYEFLNDSRRFTLLK